MFGLKITSSIFLFLFLIKKYYFVYFFRDKKNENRKHFLRELTINVCLFSISNSRIK